ncbi:MAG: hypothetical protein H6741_16610 [Alphaproteobacteria bacterium]|nr:hypothetical protein [Alphaproteobacteria bacterium]MCB9794338.1 hypothetical protein [Alphaproteobacteria bacterium]
MGLNGDARATDPERARPILLDEAPGAPVLADRRETWTRARRGKPVGDQIPVRLPWILVEDSEQQDRLDALLSPETLIGASREEVEDEGWIDRVDYEPGRCDARLVELRIRIEGSGAYPVTRTRVVVVDPRQARVLGAEQFSAPERLAAHVDAVLQARARASEVTEDTALAELMENRRFTAGDLGRFSLAPDGLVFHHRWGFPHMLQAHAPDPEVWVPWATLELVEGSPLQP